MSKEICQEIKLIAENALDKIESSLPSETIIKFIMFTETLRVLDFHSLSSYNPTSKLSEVPKFDIMKMGWNLSTSYLFEGFKTSGFPIVESTKETFGSTSSLLYHFGCITMLKRTIDMVKSGALSVVKTDDNTFVFEKTKNVNSQFLDDLEFTNLEELEEELKEKTGEYYKEWNIIEKDDLEKAFGSPGNFLSFTDKEFNHYSSENIEKLLHDQVRPWDSGHGIMMGYGSTFDIDMHFLGKATELVGKWRDEAGLHPKTKIGNITGGDLMIVVLFMTSFHLKHISYGLVASKKHPEISIKQSLTLWGPLEDLINDIVEFSGFKKSIITEAFDSIILKPDDVKLLKKHTSKFMPLVIDIGNGIVLRPVSSINRNPLLTISQILEYRNPNFRNDISLYREEWLRNNLYAMFSGARYKNVVGNINLKTGNKIDTDIDAAIFDRMTGELALFQIKWQDFFFNDINKLKSRASNLTKGLDDWTLKVNNWITSNGLNKLLQTLRIKSTEGSPISKVYLFAISKNAARMKGYGYQTTVDNLAITNWPQFARNRFEIGPSEKVFRDLFEALKEQEKDNIETKPLPAEFIIGNKNFKYKDLWSTYGK
ncbi:hypothetical protein C7447_11022 [Tenacibaculum adriaticum]|uniref:Uncharacterized protein n=1 Tax=Tenacibaculum adriaticum TaxID=413713 RepID=A0A5S5DJD1_9FLAO|nr:hypothetical protein [Tenacibaculum adriaticum]TYP96063.1 hypothetical protein C7447_11022 [Tenacibaculum adriaticum]